MIWVRPRMSHARLAQRIPLTYWTHELQACQIISTTETTTWRRLRAYISGIGQWTALLSECATRVRPAKVDVEDHLVVGKERVQIAVAFEVGNGRSKRTDVRRRLIIGI